MTFDTFPFAPAQKYTDYGLYPIGYLCDDGEYLCADCVNDSTNPVHMGGEADGWRIEGLDVLEGSALDYDVAVVCAHCSATLGEGEA